MDYQEWENSGRPQAIHKEMFELRREAFITGDFSRQSYADTPLNTGGIGYDAPFEENTWEYEAAQHVDRRIKRLASDIKDIGSRLSLPREHQTLNDLEKSVVHDFFGDDLVRWNDYLLQLQSRFGVVNPLGIAYYTKEVGIIRDNEKNFGLKHFVETYPYRGYPHDVSEDGKRFMITLYLKRGSTTEDFKAIAERTGLENALPGEPDFDVHTDYRPHNQLHARAGNVFQIFAKKFEGTIELILYGLMEDILSFIDHTEEGELVSQPELYLGPIAYHLFRGKAICAGSKHLDEAVAEYEQGLKSDSPRTTNPVIKKSFEDMVADLHYNLGLVFCKKGEPQKAVKEFRTYLDHDSTTEWAEQARKYLHELNK